MRVKRLETDRLILDRWRGSDAKDLFVYAQDPEVGPAAGWQPHESVAQSRQRIKRLFIPSGTWKIMLKDELKAIGSIGFEPDARRPGIRAKELGYSLAKDYWGKGIMTEAAREVIRYAFEEEGLAVLSIETAPNNIRSQRVIEKTGFTYEGKLRHSHLTAYDEVRDSLIYSITKEEWADLSITEVMCKAMSSEHIMKRGRNRNYG